jgi:hypothetical protein
LISRYTHEISNLRTRKDIYIPRPAVPSPSSFPAPLPHKIAARFYYAGTEQELANASTLILDIPGGGFVTMGISFLSFGN